MDGPNKSIKAILRKLSFDDLRDWAGETILNRGKGYVKQVDQLSRDVDGVALYRMFNKAISTMGAAKYLSSDNDPLFQYHQ